VMMSIARNMFASHPKTWDVFKMPSLNQRFWQTITKSCYSVKKYHASIWVNLVLGAEANLMGKQQTTMTIKPRLAQLPHLRLEMTKVFLICLFSFRKENCLGFLCFGR
jgi:hypothetical protein